MKKINSPFVDNLIKKVKIQQQTTANLQEKVLDYLKLHEGRWKNYWDLCKELGEQYGIPKELDATFREDFEKTIESMDRKKILYKSWAANMGGIVMYPYDAAERAVLRKAQSDEALLRLVQRVQYGDEL